MPFLIIFILIPLGEVLVFMQVSEHIGLGTALLMALITAILGGAIVKYQGMQTMMAAQNTMRSGGMPTKELFDGLCLVAAGAMLITPGFITDALGFALLIPAVRNALREKLSKSAKFSAGGFNAEYTEFHDTRHHHQPNDPDIIDVEYETIDKDG
ncbi:MAG: FxsA family protein [Alphaproteobacteria bacterium]